MSAHKMFLIQGMGQHDVQGKWAIKPIEERKNVMKKLLVMILGFMLLYPSIGWGTELGESCSYDSECPIAPGRTKGYCYAGPEGGYYCLHGDDNCALPGTRGVKWNYEYETEDYIYTCTNGGTPSNDDNWTSRFIGSTISAKDAFLTLDSSVYEGKGTPSCNGTGAATARDLLDALGEAVDNIYGTEFVYKITGNPTLINKLSRITGNPNGPSVCGMACVKIPAKTPLSWWVSARDSTGVTKLTTEGKEFGIGWSRLDQVSWVSSGDSALVCAHVRNWKHDRERYIRLHVEYVD